MGRLKSVVTNPRVTFLVRFVLDELLPPIVRDQRWLFVPVIRLYNGKIDPDFKLKAPLMNDDEFSRAYELLVPMRQTDVTPAVARFALSNLIGNTVLEVGCGNGDLSISCALRGFNVTATDLVGGNLELVERKSVDRNLKLETKVADVERLPFDDNCFDTVICLHTLEHVRNLSRAATELVRVTRQRLIVVVPRERYYRYSCNYHLHYFGGPEQLALLLGLGMVSGTIVDGAICYAADKETAPQSRQQTSEQLKEAQIRL